MEHLTNLAIIVSNCLVALTAVVLAFVTAEAINKEDHRHDERMVELEREPQNPQPPQSPPR